MTEEAQKIFSENFEMTTWFERTIFFSWYCETGDCKYCYMSSQKGKAGKMARRTTESILAEVFLCKKFGWPLGFVSGGNKAFSKVEFNDLLDKIVKVYGEKVWINVGALGKKELSMLLPYTKGVIAAIETLNPKLHDEICPSKPIKPMEKMLGCATELGLLKGMTIIIGLGETIDDYPLLASFVRKHGISKIHFYGLNPQKGTYFEKAKPPTAEYQAEWIAKTRIDFPKMDIQAGIWTDRVENVSVFLKAGANSISKFPALKVFGKKPAKELENQAKKAGRKFLGTLTKMPKIDVDSEVDKLELDEKLKVKVKAKVKEYLKHM